MRRWNRIHSPQIVSFLACTLFLAGCGGGTDVGGSAHTPPDQPAIELRRISQAEGGFTGTLSDFDNFGFSVAAAGDIDGDGVTDLAVGAPWNEDPQSYYAPGAIWILFMNPDLTVRSQRKLVPGEDFAAALNDGSQFGSAIAGLGDLDGNGVPDLAVGAPWHGQWEGEQAGVVLVLLLESDGSVKAARSIGPGIVGTPEDWPSTALFGMTMAVIGDLDDDGINELAVGANDPGYSVEPRPSGVHVVFLKRNGAAARVVPVSELPGAGHGVAGVGDADGDGVEDMVASATYPYLVLLRPDGSTKAVHDVTDPARNHEQRYYNLSQSVAGAGDVDGDGIGEIAFLEDNYGYRPLHSIILYYLAADGPFRMMRFIDVGRDDISSRRIAGLGDIDGDGRAEIGILTPDDDDGGPARGGFWLASLADPSGTTTTSTTTTTTETTSTTTSECLPEDCAPDEGTDWNVELYLDESRRLSAIDFRIDFDPAAGFFLGKDGDVQCDDDRSLGVLTAFNDCDTPSWSGCRKGELTGGVISIQGFQGPSRLVTCRYRSVVGEPSIEDFAITIRDAGQTSNMRRVHASLSIVISPAEE
ncbi:MAG TPA: integrin alpha [Candidatus Binatia bacterium]|nr:integrin alpha [Candidatus Binatia bacterium]